MVKCRGVQKWEQVIHTWRSGEERTTSHVQWGVEGDKHVHKRTGVGIRHAASYVLTYRLGLGCIGNTGCYTVQWGQLGLGQIGQRSSGCTDDRRRSWHKHTAARSRRLSLRVL